MPRLLRVLVPIALLGVLCVTLQGSAASWGAVFLSDGARAAGGHRGHGVRAVHGRDGLVGRLTNDRWVDRWGSGPVVRFGALTGVASLVLAILAAPVNQPLLAFIGFAGVGREPRRCSR